ncbi:MAG: YeeE/YedE family protein [Gloeocapsa sp. DLM2.Bin57]|nr:MAG: YeeE/YedE family protein [Gloeocapsa sp. DLM2.Bin57]
MELNWISPLIGGMLIGLSATILLLCNGRIAGISGMINGAITFKPEQGWRWIFLLGMILGGLIYEYLWTDQRTPPSTFSPWLMLIGGFLVGFGTRLGNGCTSGHGVCGLGRLSFRSLIAVITFMITAIITVYVKNWLLA